MVKMYVKPEGERVVVVKKFEECKQLPFGINCAYMLIQDGISKTISFAVGFENYKPTIKEVSKMAKEAIDNYAEENDYQYFAYREKPFVAEDKKEPDNDTIKYIAYTRVTFFKASDRIRVQDLYDYAVANTVIEVINKDNG